jgi:Spy/CpxP family protein refolding chaperone
MTLQGRYSSLLVAIALVAGLVIGFAGSTVSYRYGLLRIPGERPLQRMTRVLKLTPAQRDQIRQVMEDTRDKIHETRRAFQHQRRRLFIEAYLRVRALLTAEQQKTFESQFVPPRIRDEAEQMELRQGGAPTPSPTPGTAPARP